MGLLLLVLLVVCVGEMGRTQGRWVPTEQEDKELERQLQSINKPPIKTLQSKSGELFDCIDMYKQPAFDNPLLRNHTLQLRPSSVPRGLTFSKAKPATHFGFNDACPRGTVVIKRSSKEDLIAARSLEPYFTAAVNSGGSRTRRYNVAPPLAANPTNDSSTNDGNHWAILQTYTGTFYGSNAQMAVYGIPSVGVKQGSSSNIWVLGGADDQQHVNIVHAGWHVLPALYGNSTAPRFFTHWTTDGGTSTGCWNTNCAGYVHLSNAFAPGTELTHLSTYGGEQQYITITIYMDQSTKDWWIAYGDGGSTTNIGYWPHELFTNLLRSDAVQWGGQAFSPFDIPSPPMGSGHFGQEGIGKSAYFFQVNLVDSSNHFYVPENTALAFPTEDAPKYYRLADNKKSDDGYRFGYGGPGGFTSK